MADTDDSKSSAERREGSSPSPRTNLREVSNTGVDQVVYHKLIIIQHLLNAVQVILYYTVETVQLQMPRRVAEKPDD